MDPSEYEALRQWPEGWDFLSPSCDDTLQKFEELNRKQIIDWNQRKKEKMDVPAVR
ncbi:hypothetical protein Gohar_027003, partial [Gossypium harknessii]|nr:hypothetical protein [Gossypium harknessii]